MRPGAGFAPGWQHQAQQVYLFCMILSLVNMLNYWDRDGMEVLRPRSLAMVNLTTISSRNSFVLIFCCPKHFLYLLTVNVSWMFVLYTYCPLNGLLILLYDNLFASFFFIWPSFPGENGIKWLAQHLQEMQISMLQRRRHRPEVEFDVGRAYQYEVQEQRKK